MMQAILAFDAAAEQWLYAARDPLVVQVSIGASELASETTVIGITLAIIILLAYRKRWAYCTGIIVSVGGSAAVAFVLKHVIVRARPPLDIRAIVETSSSFPSGHATLAAALYGYLVWMLSRTLPSPWNRLSVLAAGAIILLVGGSRLYLGVHYPSDVLAGFLLGGIFAYAGARVARAFMD